MTVEKLIEKLREYPPYTQVGLLDSSGHMPEDAALCVQIRCTCGCNNMRREDVDL